MMSLVLVFVSACATKPKAPKKVILNGDNLPKFSYLDGLRTAKTVNCASKSPTSCMACALQGEAANQPGKGIYAVGVTIMTRAKGNIKRICKVTKARRQFEGMRRRGKRKISRKVWKVTKHILSSQETGWTHFWAPRTQRKLKRRKPAWAHVFEKRKCRKKRISGHIFFNINKCKFDRRMRLNANVKKEATEPKKQRKPQPST